ncbi:MAG: HAMP domain-containing histidine kinase [Campylobacterales bacterium]|nr:HAMP domain-containing histidine kinase [Campylobacterales bacterium]
MPRYSILITVLIALAVTLSTVSFTVWEFYQLNRQQYLSSIFSKSQLIRQIYGDSLQRESISALLETNLALYQLFVVHDEALAKKVLREGKKAQEESFETPNHLQDQENPSFSPADKNHIEMLFYAEKVYFRITTLQTSLLLEARDLKPYHMGNLLYAYLTIVSIILFSFFYILKSFYPLRRLRDKIKKFAEGDLHVSFKVEGNDEISEVSNEFDNAAKKINTLIESRNLFMRNIMHELKTPITKGRFSVEMLENTKYKSRLLNVFIRMEGLINEMALIEQIASGFEQTRLEDYRAVDVISEAIDLGFFESDNYVLDINSDLMLHVDYKLFATAVKNMIDNAIKYSDDKKVVITAREGKLLFENYGKGLDEPLSYYTEPFTKSHKAVHSFGLGLYIVNAILESHGYRLRYEHLNGWNRFWFELKEPMAKERITKT